MNAMPQLIRCFERQWAGLSRKDQDLLMTDYGLTFRPQTDRAGYIQIIWQVWHSNQQSTRPCDCLISIKED